MAKHHKADPETSRREVGDSRRGGETSKEGGGLRPSRENIVRDAVRGLKGRVFGGVELERNIKGEKKAMKKVAKSTGRNRCFSGKEGPTRRDKRTEGEAKTGA